MALSGLEQRLQPLGNTFLEPNPCQKPRETQRRRSKSYPGYPRFLDVMEYEELAFNPSGEYDGQCEIVEQRTETADEDNMYDMSCRLPQATTEETDQIFEEIAIEETEDSCEGADCTTIMIRNIPRISQTDLLAELDRTGFQDMYDFAYMPCQFTTGLGKGYAFVNFLTPELALSMTHSWNKSRRFGMGRTQPSLSVAMASVQGFTANMEKWNDPRLRRIRNASLRPFVAAFRSSSYKPGKKPGLQETHMELDDERKTMNTMRSCGELTWSMSEDLSFGGCGVAHEDFDDFPSAAGIGEKGTISKAPGLWEYSERVFPEEDFTQRTTCTISEAPVLWECNERVYPEEDFTQRTTCTISKAPVLWECNERAYPEEAFTQRAALPVLLGRERLNLPVLLGRERLNLCKALDVTSHQEAQVVPQDKAQECHIPAAPIPYGGYNSYQSLEVEPFPCLPLTNTRPRCIPPPPTAPPPAFPWTTYEEGDDQTPTSEPYIVTPCNTADVPVWSAIEQPLQLANQAIPQGLPLKFLEQSHCLLDENYNEYDFW